VRIYNRIRDWLCGAPASDPCTRYNAPAMQVLLLAYAVLRLATSAWQAAAGATGAAHLAGDLLVVASATGGVALIRRGMFRVSVILFLVGLLCSIEFTFLAHGAQARIADAQTPMILALVTSGVMLGRRALWRVFGALVLLFASALFAGQRDADPLQALRSMPPTAVLFLLIALVLDRYIRALQQRLADATIHQAELRREMEARERAQARLVHARKVEAAGQLASGIAHDFNNILDLILGYASQRERILGTQDLAMQKAAIVRVLDGVEGAAMRGAALTRKLLDFNRFVRARPQSFDATGALAELQPLLRHLLPRTIELALPVEDGPVFVLFDRGEFDLMVLNIASNARDAMAQGGRFAVRLAREGPHVRIAFADTGHGMAEEVRERVFEPFFTTRASGGGTGLGLAVIRDIVLACDGDIAVESELGNGSTFHVRIPAGDALV